MSTTGQTQPDSVQIDTSFSAPVASKKSNRGKKRTTTGNVVTHAGAIGQGEFDMEKFFKPPDEHSTEDFLGTVANPYHFRSWWNSIQAVGQDNYTQRALLYQRALHYLPGSYKLWYHFLKESRAFIKKNFANEKGQIQMLDAEHYEIENELFERALVYLNKIPKIWLDYAKFTGKHQLRISDTRRIYDRALVALPVTQHQLIWDQYLEWAQSLEDYTDTACHVYRRYIDFKPEETEYYIDYLLNNDLLEEALDLYLKLLQNEEAFVSVKGKTRYQMWMELCEFIAKNPKRCNFSKPENIIRHGIRKYTDEVAKLWIYLAEYYTRQALFGKARDVFEEALATITTARDFGIIFNAYMKFEEQMLETEDLDDEDEEEDDEEEEGSSLNEQLEMLIDLAYKDIPERHQEDKKMVEQEELKMNKDEKENARLFKLENLIQRRPFLMSNTVLRQNPHNVYEWLNRISLSKDDPYLAIKTYTEAITTVDPQQAFGKLSKIWISFARFYEAYNSDDDQQSENDLSDANLIYHKATQLQFKSVEETANVYCQWAEMHLRQRNYQSAIKIMQHAVTGNKPPQYGQYRQKGKQQKYQKRGEAASGEGNDEGNDQGQRQNSLHNNLKAWNFYEDLLQNLSTVDNTRQAYERMLEMKLATPQTILNYAQFLQQHHYFEDSYRVYERALQVFHWPHVYEIWGCYLSSIIERYSDSKVERIRDLFEQVLKSQGLPPKQAKLFFLMYADFEENFGLINHAMKIYDRAACKENLDKEDKFEIYNLYISKAAEFFGVNKTRQLYERSFEFLQGADLIQIGLRFAKLERKMGEIDRARGIYQHLSQFCNPRVKENEDQFWNIWEKFEVYHGNEDTYSDYMKAKRTVELRYSVATPIINMDNQGSKLIEELQNEGDKLIE